MNLKLLVGHTCNYAVVMAQLYTQGKCHGIHPFIVQLRDEDTWMPMPGKILKNEQHKFIIILINLLLWH